MFSPKTLIILVLLITGVCFLCSCQGFYDFMRAKPEPVSDFLPHKELLKKTDSRFPFHYAYLAPDCGEYTNIYIAPINTSYIKNTKGLKDLNKRTNGKLEEELNKLTTYVRDATIKAFIAKEGKDCLKVVHDQNTPDSVTLEMAIAAITPAKGEWNVLGFAADMVIGLGSIFTSQFAYGSLTIEGKVIDNKTGKVIAMFATTEQDEDAIINVSNFTWFSSAKTNANKFAKYTAEVFNAQDYKQIKRDFPYQIFSF